MSYQVKCKFVTFNFLIAMKSCLTPLYSTLPTAAPASLTLPLAARPGRDEPCEVSADETHRREKARASPKPRRSAPPHPCLLGASTRSSTRPSPPPPPGASPEPLTTHGTLSCRRAPSTFPRFSYTADKTLHVLLLLTVFCTEDRTQVGSVFALFTSDTGI